MDAFRLTVDGSEKLIGEPGRRVLWKSMLNILWELS
jgi:hypothetical protein